MSGNTLNTLLSPQVVNKTLRGGRGAAVSTQRHDAPPIPALLQHDGHPECSPSQGARSVRPPFSVSQLQERNQRRENGGILKSRAAAVGSDYDKDVSDGGDEGCSS